MALSVVVPLASMVSVELGVSIAVVEIVLGIAFHHLAGGRLCGAGRDRP
jgi:hypothetical protein